MGISKVGNSLGAFSGTIEKVCSVNLHMSRPWTSMVKTTVH